jgi:hypothetical protein
MKTKIIGLIALVTLVLFFGCTQEAIVNNNGNISINDSDFNKDNLTDTFKGNDMNMPNLSGCERMNYAWKCNLDMRVSFDSNDFFEKVNELNDSLGAFCYEENINNSMTSSTVDSNLIYYCLQYLDDSSKVCTSSLDCKGSCMPSINSNYDSTVIENEIGTKISCPSCTGICTSQIFVGESGTKWLEFNNGFIEVNGVQ